MAFIFPHNPLPSPGAKIVAIKGSKVLSFNVSTEKYEIPEFVGKLEDQTYLNGDNFVLRIGYKGCPEPLVQWYKGQEPIISDLDSTKIVITADSAYAQLALFNAQREDGGFYNCRIENANGVRETGCHIFITNDGPGGPKGMQRC
uniref:Ig-like domain-containing protein n=1 Tax=Meloidogyne hapla TaxID=6305 RepID=A0A1I8BSC4_MELHA